MRIFEKLKHQNYSLDTIGKSDSQVLIFDDSVLKIQKNNFESQNELNTLLWLEKQNEIISPTIFDSEIIDNKLYILMSKIQNEVTENKNDFTMACDEYFLNNENLLTEMISKILNNIWNLDISNCPSNHNLERKLLQAEFNVKNNLIDIEDCQEETFSTKDKKGKFENPQELLNWLKENKPTINENEKCFPHGDFCLPNIFFNKTNKNNFGIIDVGRAGIIDKWNDIAICYRSLRDNTTGIYGKGKYKFDENLFFQKLKIKPDWKKINYYILLDELF
jgi:kanamycin kinase/aminoglycoside 3'-phosphotransferase-3